MNADARDHTDRLLDAVRDARSRGTHLLIRGGGTRGFLDRETGDADARVLDLTGHRGIVQYEPGELVIRARSGTPLAEIEQVLAAEGQELPFEPPRFGALGTLGGAVASGFSGPARPYRGALRDAILGARIINGLGEALTFGGQVMKNVAGYDVSRLMVGARGTLGVLLDVSLKVLPRAEAELTIVQGCDGERAIRVMRELARAAHPVTATAWDGECLRIRLAGTERGVAAAARAVGGETMADGANWWTSLRDRTHPYFAPGANLWRIGLAAATPWRACGEFVEWGGALRWQRLDEKDDLRARSEVPEAHCLIFRASPASTLPRFQPMTPTLRNLHARIRESFDPHGLFNRACFGEMC